MTVGEMETVPPSSSPDTRRRRRRRKRRKRRLIHPSDERERERERNIISGTKRATTQEKKRLNLDREPSKVCSLIGIVKKAPPPASALFFARQ